VASNPICFRLTNICEGSCNSRVSNNTRDVSVIVKGKGLRDSLTVIVGPLKSTILYHLKILQQRIFQFVVKREAVAFNLEVSGENIKLTTSRQL